MEKIGENWEENALKKNQEVQKANDTRNHRTIKNVIVVNNNIRVENSNKNENRNVAETRCESCFISHFPHPKFCKWSIFRKKSSLNFCEPKHQLTDAIKKLIRERIENIEASSKNEKHQRELKVVHEFFKESSHSTSLSDICFQTYENGNLKLKGGTRIKIFDTDRDEIVKVLTLFRSLRVFDNFKEHSKCKLSSRNPKDSLCSFCLMRSIIFKSKICKGRQIIKPMEILCNIPVKNNIEQTYEVVDQFLENISRSYIEFQKFVLPFWHCNECQQS